MDTGPVHIWNGIDYSNVRYRDFVEVSYHFRYTNCKRIIMHSLAVFAMIDPL